MGGAHYQGRSGILTEKCLGLSSISFGTELVSEIFSVQASRS